MNPKGWILCGLLVLQSALFAQNHPELTVRFDQAAVVSARAEASQAGAEIMRNGGNAIDAAVSTHFMLAVCYPQAGNIGGGGFALVYKPGEPVKAFDFREMAPLAASRNMFLDENGNPVPRLATHHPLGVGVPGSVHGIYELHRRFGKLAWRELLKPAVEMALNGFVLTEKDAREFNEARNDLMSGNPDYPRFWKQELWKSGDTLRQPELAITLQRIADFGAEDFYNGELARMWIEDLRKRGGIITAEDARNYRTVERKPVSARCFGFNIYSMPPPSSGGYILLHMLKMLEADPRPLPTWLSAEYISRIVEIERLAYADRSEHLGDPDFWTQSPEFLLNPDYIKKRRNLIPTENKAGNSENVKPGSPVPYESEQTTHFSICDPNGMCVAITTTINSPFGARIASPSLGFLFNNEMDDFSMAPGVPNQFGLLGNEANAIAPGKRMLSAMTPTIVFSGEQPVLITGTPGGATIITSIFQQLVTLLCYQKSLNDWTLAPRFHHQWLPDIIYLEKNNWPQSVIRKLQKMGYKIVLRDPIGRVNSIRILPDGSLESGFDLRGDDAASGF